LIALARRKQKPCLALGARKPREVRHVLDDALGAFARRGAHRRANPARCRTVEGALRRAV
jgi:hypothetical protein